MHKNRSFRIRHGTHITASYAKHVSFLKAKQLSNLSYGMGEYIYIYIGRRPFKSFRLLKEI